jgi:Domain of unknown function (DUF4407)
MERYLHHWPGAVLRVVHERRYLVGSPIVWLSGAQQDILARFKADRPKYAGMGSAVLITATMAGVSMAFALHSALKVSLAAAIPSAVAWGLAIMSLDRWLVVSLVRQQNKLGYLLLALPRVALAILFGLIISTPFTLQIFQPEINRQIPVIHEQRAENFNRNQATNSLAKTIKADQAQVKKDEAIIQSQGETGQNPGQDPTVQYLTKQLNQANGDANSDYDTWNCQVSGAPVGSVHCVAGDGNLAQAAHKSYLADEQKMSDLHARIRAREQQIAINNKNSASNILATAETDKAQVEKQLKTDLDEQAHNKNEFNSANSSNAGLLLRLQALDQVAAGSGTLQAARLLLFLFFTAIECLPVLVKVLLNLGPQTSYEQALAHAERAGLQLVEQETLLQRREARLESDALSDEAERLRAEWQANALPEIIHDTTAARERVARSRLEKWEWRETAGIDDDGFTGPGGLSGTGRLMGTDWTVTRRSRRSRSPSMMPQRRSARQARRNMKAPHQPARSAWPYWPDSL